MEQINFLNSRGLKLVGDFSSASSTAGVVLAHGFTSDRLSKGRFPRIALRLNEVGYNTLAFDFSGCGESDDDSLTAAKQVDDLLAAVAYMKTRGVERLALWGHSLGSRICLQANPPEALTMVLTGAATGPLYYHWEDYYSAEQLDELARTGLLTIYSESGLRRKTVLAAQMLQDFAEVDQPKLLGSMRCPVLIIHGDADEEERQLLALSKAGLAYLPPGSRLEIIPGANHSFLEQLERVIELGLNWLPLYLDPRAG